MFCEDPGCRDALAEFRPLARRHGWAPRKFSRAGVTAWSAKGSGRSCNGALANWTAFRKTERARLQSLIHRSLVGAELRAQPAVQLQAARLRSPNC